MKQNIIRFIGATLNTTAAIAPKKAASIALRLFASPKKGKMTDADIPVVQSAFFEEIDYDQYSIATYRWIGDKETILLCHGWESNSARWKDLIRLLKEQSYTVICIDGPAHGKSSGKEFNAILYAEFINVIANKFNPEIIIGHSVGGMASVFFQNKYKLAALDKLVLLGAPAHFEGVFDRYKKMMGFNTKISNSIDKLIFERFGNYPDHYNASAFSKNIEAETLLVHDEKDMIIPFEDVELYHQNLPNSTLVKVSNQGHSLKGESTNKAILEFIGVKEAVEI